MTKEQRAILEKYHHKYVVFMQDQYSTFTNAEYGELAALFQQLYGRPVKLSCAACVKEMLQGVYAKYTKEPVVEIEKRRGRPRKELQDA